jgi:DNA-binding NarL/FixJ family response regulator
MPRLVSRQLEAESDTTNGMNQPPIGLGKPYLSTLLTMQEREILPLLVQGFSNKAIADAMGIPQRKVGFYRRQITLKLARS